MVQEKNINDIEYIREVLEELERYSIDVSNYYSCLENIISCYEEKRKNEITMKSSMEAQVSFGPSTEVELSINLNNLKNDLYYYIMFLDLIHSTNDWSLDIDIDEIFYKVSNNFNTLLDGFYQIDIQKIIIEKYYDLLLKKILKDYLNNDLELIDKYDDLKSQVYLRTSIKRYLNSSNISLDSEISNYNLKDIVNNIINNKEKSSKEIEEKKEDSQTNNNVDENYEIIVANHPSNDDQSLKMKIQILKSNWHLSRIKRKIEKEYPALDYEWLGNIELAWELLKHECYKNIRNKDLSFLNLNYKDLSTVNFDGVTLRSTQMKYSKANIDPQKIVDKNLINCDLEGIDLSNADFSSVFIYGINFKNTKVKLDLQKVLYRCAENCNFEGIDLSNVDLNGVHLAGANFNNTGAIFDFRFLEHCISMAKRDFIKRLYHGEFKDKLNGCYILISENNIPNIDDHFYGDKDIIRNVYNETGATIVTSYDEIEKIKNQKNKCLKKK